MKTWNTKEQMRMASFFDDELESKCHESEQEMEIENDTTFWIAESEIMCFVLTRNETFAW